MSRCLLLSSVALLTSAVAVPVHELDRRQTVDCSPAARTGLNPACWDQLGMAKFIDDWMEANATAANCDTLGFAQCFLQFNGFGGLTCDLITSNTCPPFPTTDNGTYYSNQQFYALWNIYSIYQFFNQYSQALSNGASLAGQTVDDIVATVAPPIEAQEQTSTLTTILSSTLGIVTTAAGLIPGDVGTGTNILLGGLSAVLSLSSDAASQLTQTANDRAIQLGQIGSSLAQFVSDYQDNLLKTVQMIQRNSTLFVAAATSGSFSQRVTTSLTVQSRDLYRQLQLFVLSSALRANGIVSSRSTGVNALDFAKQTREISCTALDPGGNCNQWWIDAAAGNTYAFHNPNDWENTQIDLTKAIVDKGWATLDQVFKVEECAGKTPTFDTGSISVRCTATHNFCEWNYQQNLTATRREPQWKNCEDDRPWGSLCSSFENRILVPESYLGPLLVSTSNFCKRR